jgi:hypothetical protein
MIALQEILEPLPERQTVLAIVLAVTMLIVVVELVRKRKLREEYSFLWVGTAAVLLLLAVKQDLIIELSKLFGAADSSSTLFFLALVFLMLLCLQFSVRMSKLTSRNKALSQRIALLEREMEEIRRPQREVQREKSRKGGAA